MSTIGEGSMTTVGFSEFSAAFSQALGGEERIETSNKSDIVQACSVALKGIQIPEGKTSIEHIATLLTEGARKNKKLAAKIAEALYKTPLYDNASKAVRRQIDGAMQAGTTWIRAKLSGLYRQFSNWKAYGADSDRKQNAMLDAAFKSFEQARGNHLSPQTLDTFSQEISTYNEKNIQNPIDLKQATRFFTNVFMVDWKKVAEEAKAPSAAFVPTSTRTFAIMPPSDKQEEEPPEEEGESLTGPLAMMEPLLEETAALPAEAEMSPIREVERAQGGLEIGSVEKITKELETLTKDTTVSTTAERIANGALSEVPQGLTALQLLEITRRLIGMKTKAPDPEKFIENASFFFEYIKDNKASLASQLATNETNFTQILRNTMGFKKLGEQGKKALGFKK